MVVLCIFFFFFLIVFGVKSLATRSLNDEVVYAFISEGKAEEVNMLVLSQV
jgi:hypothetical protein